MIRTKPAPLEPILERVGNLVAPELAEALQPSHVLASRLHADGASSRSDAVGHLGVASGTRDHFHNMANVLGVPSGARKHATDDERTVVARPLARIMRAKCPSENILNPLSHL